MSKILVSTTTKSTAKHEIIEHSLVRRTGSRPTDRHWNYQHHAQCCHLPLLFSIVVVGVVVVLTMAPFLLPTRLATLRSPGTRLYHATRQQEILPILAVGMALVVGRYSYRALRRMDEEWEEYEWELQRYKGGEDTRQKVISVDLGSAFVKLAVSHPVAQVLVDRKGDRSTFAGVVFDDDVAHTGRAALERLAYSSKNGRVAPLDDKLVLPFTTLNQPTLSDATVELGMVSKAISQTLDSLLKDAAHQLGTTDDIPLVVAVPSHADTDRYASVLAAFLEQHGRAATYLPDSVASVWGAIALGILPSGEESAKKILVVDVGALETQLSTVEGNSLLSTSSLPMGGESLVTVVVNILRAEAKTTRDTDLQDLRSLASMQVNARDAIYNHNQQVKIHVPYLFADPGNHHLDLQLSRSRIDREIQSWIHDSLIPTIDEDSLSKHFKRPVDMESLFTSSLTQQLEKSGISPIALDHVLLVGGASRYPLVQSSLRAALVALMGPDADRKLVVPDPAVVAELAALGPAAVFSGSVGEVQA